MSETTQTSEYVPQHVLQSEDNEDATKPLQQPQEPSQEAAEDKPQVDEAEELRRAERRREAQRIGYLTKQRYAEKARADALEQRLREYEEQLRAQNPGAAPPQPTPQDLEAWVEQRAAQKLAQQQHDQKFAAWEQEAAEQFGLQKFRDACKTVAEMASDQQRRTLSEVITDTEGGQRAIMHLAENPEEAERILAMPAHRMALAVAKLGAPPAAEAKPQVSNAPPPIRPPSVGRARGEPDPEHGDYSSYERWSAKAGWRR